MARRTFMEYRDPRTYGAKKRRLKAILDEWARRLEAAKGRPNRDGWVSPSRLSYGALVTEYTRARDRSRWFRGLGPRPEED